MCLIRYRKLAVCGTVAGPSPITYLGNLIPPVASNRQSRQSAEIGGGCGRPRCWPLSAARPRLTEMFFQPRDCEIRQIPRVELFTDCQTEFDFLTVSLDEI